MTMREGSDSTVVDVTQYLKDCAANHLSEQNPYVADESNFSLHDAMSATQLFDSKLDCCEVSGEKISGWNIPGVQVFPRPIPTSLEDPMSPLPWNSLSISDARNIALQVMVRLHSLLKGCAVGDSCFTCLYAHYNILVDMANKLLGANHEQHELADSLQRLSLDERSRDHSETDLAQWAVFATALGLVVLSAKIKGIIQFADIYEEEDFTVASHGLRFFSLSDSTAHNQVFALVESKLASNMRLYENGKVSLLVLRFISSFYSACLTLEKICLDFKTQSIANAKDSIQQATSALSELYGLVGKESTEVTDETCNLLRQCFDPYIVRPLVGNLPVRAYSVDTPTKAIKDLTDIVSELKTHVCTLLERGSSLGRIQRMLSCVQGTNILTRSLILANFYSAEKLLGQYPFEKMISDHLHHQYSSQPEPGLWLSNSDGEAFIRRMAKPIYGVLKLYLLNKNRLRAHLEVFVLPDWSILQKEAQVVDFQYQVKHGSTFPHFTHYVLTMIVSLMDLYISSGIQDGLVSYNHTDLWFHLWYRDFLLSTLHQHLSIIRQAKDMTVVERKDASVPTPKRGKKKNKHKNGKVKEDIARPDPEDLVNSFHLKIVALRRNVCRKTIHFLAALSKAGILQEKKYDFTSTENIFERRFEIFGCIQQPPRLSYQQFQEGTDFTNVSLDDFPLYIADGFQNCKASIDQLIIERGRLDPSWCGISEEELKSLRKLCIGNAVYAQKLAQIVAAGDSCSAELDFSAHAEFCIIKLSSSTNTAKSQVGQ